MEFLNSSITGHVYIYIFSFWTADKNFRGRPILSDNVPFLSKIVHNWLICLFMKSKIIFKHFAQFKAKIKLDEKIDKYVAHHFFIRPKIWKPQDYIWIFPGFKATISSWLHHWWTHKKRIVRLRTTITKVTIISTSKTIQIITYKTSFLVLFKYGAMLYERHVFSPFILFSRNC